MAQNPTLNANNGTTSPLFSYIPSTAPFTPAATAPYDWTLAINYAPYYTGTTYAVSSPYQVAIDAYGNAWLSNTSSVALLGVDGSSLITPATSFTASTTSGAIGQFTTNPTSNSITFASNKGVAVDLSGRAWVANEGTANSGATPASYGTVGVVSASANQAGIAGTFGNTTPTATTTGFYSGYQPWGVAIDGSNNVFVAQTGTAGSTEVNGRSLAKFLSASGSGTDGNYSFSTSVASSPGPAPNQIPGGQALVAVDTNSVVTGGIVWTLNFNTCKSTVGQMAASGTAVPYGLINLNNPSNVQSLADSETTTTYSGAVIGNGTASNCASSSTGVAQTFTAPMANPFGIAVDRNNGIWISDENTSSQGFNGLTYLTAPTNASGNIATSYYLADGTVPTTTTPASTGSTISKPSMVAVDGNNNVWGANQSTGSVYEASYNGGSPVLLTPGAGGAVGTNTYGLGFTHNLSTAIGIAVDPSGNVWVTNTGSTTYTSQTGTSVPDNNSVTVIVGAAGPVVTPLSVAIHNNHLGTKP